MPLHLVQADAMPSTPWRNGAGTARMLLQWPTPSHMLVNVALAEITADAAFSDFSGMQRWFMSLSDVPVRLVHGRREATLDASSAPHEFDGADAPHCQLLAGPISNLSFMVPQAQGQATMMAAEEGVALNQAATWRGVFTASACLLHGAGADAVQLPPRTLAWSATSAPSSWRLQSGKDPLQAWWLVFQAIRP